MKKEFSKNLVEVFGKALFHYVPKIMNYIDEIEDKRKSRVYTMRYLIISEMMMFLSEGKSQRFTETGFQETNFNTDNAHDNANNRAFRYMWRI